MNNLLTVLGPAIVMLLAFVIGLVFMGLERLAWRWYTKRKGSPPAP